MEKSYFNLIEKRFDLVIHNLIRYAGYYFEDSNLKSLIIGISGGIDSAVVTALSRIICDKLHLNLHGYFLHIDGNKEDEGERAYKIGTKFCDFYSSIALTKTVNNLAFSMDSSFSKSNLNLQEKIRLGNIKARTRMIFLYNEASKNNGLVMSTDNFTEYNLGFWTLHGDVGDYGLIQGLWKTEVYEIAKLLGPECMECINANPTDGLGITNSDIDQLLPDWTPEQGSHIDAYRKIDNILINYLNNPAENCEDDNSVIQARKRTFFKRNNPKNIDRDFLIEKIRINSE